MSTESNVALWAVNVQGPDDLFAAPSKEEAERRARRMNASKLFAECNSTGAIMEAVVIPWPDSAGDHKEDLATWDKEQMEEATKP